MIRMLDEIHLHPHDIEAVQQHLHSHYLPYVKALNVTLAQQWLSPAIAVAGQPITLWLAWDFPEDIWGFWAYRSGLQPPMIEYWDFVDSVCISRKRHTLTDPTSARSTALPDTPSNTITLDVDNNAPEFWSGQLYLDTSPAHSAVEESLRSVDGLRWSKNIEGSVGAGDYTLDLVPDTDSDDIASRLKALSGIGKIDQVRYRRLVAGAQEPRIANPIWRTLMLSIRPDAHPDDIHAWQQANIAMPDYMPSIRNWSFGEVTSESRWTHIWQQEFRSTEDLLGDYMTNDYHWGWVDHWFDREFPDFVVDAQLCHAFGGRESSFIAQQLG